MITDTQTEPRIPVETPEGLTQNPFPGLRPFTVEESHLFFGREGQSEEVLEKLADNRFVAVIGPSGSGKSSLIYCGLVPVLQGGFIAGTGSRWRIVVTRPGNRPVENLAESIAESISSATDDENKYFYDVITAATLRTSSLGLIEALRQMRLEPDENVLLLIDQFEELFRYRLRFIEQDSVNESLAYVKLLINAVQQTEMPVYVAITMRSDFIGESGHFQELTSLINQSHYLIPQMTRDDYRKAISGPIAVAGAGISSALVNQLLNDVGDRPDQLPILQHALMRTWGYWEKYKLKNEPIDISHYDAIGRMGKALSDHANEAFDELDERGKEICESIFKSLTERGGDNSGTRFPTSVRDLSEIARATPVEIIHVLEKFRAPGRSFLTPAYPAPLKEDTVIDISHESLMRIWDKLKIWVDEETASVKMYLRLAEAANNYQQGKASLWRPPDLQLALNWRRKEKPTLTWARRFDPSFERAMIFLETSEKEYEAEVQNKIRLQKRALRRSRISALILGGVAIIALGFLLYAFVLRAEALQQERIATEQKKLAEQNALEANTQRTEAENQRLKAQEKEKEAIKEKEIAERERENAEFQRKNALQSAAEAIRQKAYAVEQKNLADEQRQLAEDNARKAIRQQKLADSLATIASNQKEEAYRLRMISIAQSMAVKSIQITENEDEKKIAAYLAYSLNREYNGPQHNSDIYNALFFALKEEGTFPELLQGHRSAVNELLYLNKKLFSASTDGSVLLWIPDEEKPTGKAVFRGASILQSLSIDPTLSLLAVGSQGNIVQFFDLNGNKSEYGDLNVPGSLITRLAFIPGRKQLLTVTDLGIPLLWNLSTGQSQAFDAEASGVISIAVSPDATGIALGTTSGHILLFDASDVSRIQKRLTDGAGVHALAFTPDNTKIVSGNRSGLIRVWNLAGGEAENALIGHRARITRLLFSPQGDYLASSSLDGSVRLWLSNDYNQQPVVLKDAPEWVWSIAFNNDQTHLYAALSNGAIQVWPLQTAAMAQALYTRIQRNPTPKEWEKYVAPDIPYKKINPALP